MLSLNSLSGLSAALGFGGPGAITLRDEDFEEFADLLSVNDRVAMELSGSEHISSSGAPAAKDHYEIDPPQVIVVGQTSAGKSSLLERVVGYRLFPVKESVCTRRPFKVHMRYDPSVPSDHAVLTFQSGVDASLLSPSASVSSLQSSSSSSSSSSSAAAKNVSSSDDLPVASAAHSSSASAAAASGGVSSNMASNRRVSESSGHKAQFNLPADLDQVRAIIERAQASRDEQVSFTSAEIRAEIRSNRKDSFLFTDLPGIFTLADRRQQGQDYAQTQAHNNDLKEQTLRITREYISQPNTIVLVVISALDWLHSINNDVLVGPLTQWLEETRARRDVPVYGVITKLDMCESLHAGSVVKKLLLNQLPADHILQGLQARQWIPIISNPTVLAEGATAKAAAIEKELVAKCLKKCITPDALVHIPAGRSSLLKALKLALLKAISQTHATMRASIDAYIAEIVQRLADLPQTALPAEKRRIFDARLKVLEHTLGDLIGAKGQHRQAVDSAQRSLRMQLMVDIPAAFEASLTEVSLRSDVVAEVAFILNQAALEQGGSFESDVTFNSLSTKIIEAFTAPCLRLVEASAAVVGQALLQAAHAAFGEYPTLLSDVLTCLGVSASGQLTSLSFGPSYPSPHVVSSFVAFSHARGTRMHAPAPAASALSSASASSSAASSSSTPRAAPSHPRTQTTSVFTGAASPGEDDLKTLFGFLCTAAHGKVLQLLDSMGTMTSYHPMWRNFDALYHRVIARAPATAPTPQMGSSAMFPFGLKVPIKPAAAGADAERDVERALEQILDLGSLAQLARSEGSHAIAQYEAQTHRAVPEHCKEKINKHFARVQVMAYIVRLTLLSAVPPIVLRDLRDGLFAGARFGLRVWSEPVTTALRMQLSFDQQEAKLFAAMEPSKEDLLRREQLTKKHQTLVACRDEFIACQGSLKRLAQLFAPN